MHYTTTERVYIIHRPLYRRRLYIDLLSKKRFETRTYEYIFTESRARYDVYIYVYNTHIHLDDVKTNFTSFIKSNSGQIHSPSV